MRAWENFLTLQEKELGSDTVNKWLRSLKVLRYDACNLYLEANDSFQMLWFEEHMRQKAQTKLFNNNNKRIKIHLHITNATIATKKLPLKKSRESNIPAPPPFLLNFDTPDPHCTFEHFVSAEANFLPYKLLSEICGHYIAGSKSEKAHTELGAFNPIYLHGISGTGKTHLLSSAAHALRQRGLNVIYAHAQTFTDHVVTAIRAGGMSTFRQAYRNIDVLLIDDVHVFSRKGATQEEFFHTFNTLHVAGKQIILTAHCPPQELQMIEPRLISRFEWGIVLPLEPLKEKEIALILHNKAKALNFDLSPKVNEYLLETFTSSPKALMRALEALILRAHLSNDEAGPLTVALAKHCLADLIHDEAQSAITADKIIQSVAEQHGIRSEDILGKAQTRECVLPRQIAMFLCRNKLDMPFTKIGDIFSRDHSTVMSSVKQIQKNVDQGEKEIALALSKVLKKLHV